MVGLPTYFSQYVESFLSYNTSLDYLVSLGLFVVIFLVFLVGRSLVLYVARKATKKTAFTYDDMVLNFVRGIGIFFYIYISFFISIQSLNMPNNLSKLFLYGLYIVIAFYFALGLSKIVDYYVKYHVRKRRREEKLENISMFMVFGVIVKIIIWVIILLFVLSHFGFEITPLLAGLGIGGVAIAFALQKILEDLFNAFVIYFDKPFREGDFIIVGSDMGTVKRIGIKTTRIAALSGQELVLSNSDLTSSRINNYKQMETRRVSFTFGVEYSTPTRKLKKINDIVKKIIKGIKDAKFDRVHFKEFGDSSLNFEVVYYVPTSDYIKYMDIQQEINLKIKDALEKEKVEFAFPSRTLYLRKDD